MKIALIPPVPSLRTYAELGDVHMLLADLFNQPDYVEFYRERSSLGEYLILDNGAHEDRAMDAISLLARARLVRANEIVMPDVPQNATATIEAAKDSLAKMGSPAGRETYTYAGRPRLMYVPHGRDFDSWRSCLKRLLNVHEQASCELSGRRLYSRPVIAIAKHYVEQFEDRATDFYDAILETVEEQQVFSPRGTEVHLIGWPRNLWAINILNAHARSVGGRIRSVDSARPFVYAKHGVLLEPGGKIPKYPKRQLDYFDTPILADEDDITRRNIEVFRASATDRLIA